MVRIGICDDSIRDRERIKIFCNNYFQKNDVEYQCLEFSSGEELLAYCYRKKKENIDLLFLDVEMGKIDGISVRQELQEVPFVKRIVFITGHAEVVLKAFGEKVIGFAEKPVSCGEVDHWLDIVIREVNKNITIVYDGFNRTDSVETEQIEYIKAEKNYTMLYLNNQQEGILVPLSMKDWEEKLKKLPLLRVHKSYIVNLYHVTNVTQEISLRDNPVTIPVGRSYQNKVREKYMNYVAEKVRGRL